MQSVSIPYRSTKIYIYIYSFERTFFFPFRLEHVSFQSLFPGEKRSCRKGKYYDASIRNPCLRVTPYPPPPSPYRYETLTVPIIAYPQSRSLFPSSFSLFFLLSLLLPLFSPSNPGQSCARFVTEPCPTRPPCPRRRLLLHRGRSFQV